ncbi:hypothetical protein J4H86_19615 [Spiractinospora alimapuensis]|uniref:hypothetical protein n=1 Tax=Spiractinospora alimapuensis TaxID=2820884 RepID=UPI001F31EF3A|nr:hypothetical protein [Spiractinospora alimapuensis]QVQ51033.1 hypothetical protein J4H86_19615 [Spiractinospora alimapuensis]
MGEADQEGPSTQEFATVEEFGEDDEYQPQAEGPWDVTDSRDDAHGGTPGEEVELGQGQSAEFDNRGANRGLRARIGKNSFADEFPDFDESQGGEVVYPGYDNIAYLPETAGTAKAVLGLGIASVLFFPLGLILGAIGLLLAPKARRSIRESNGELEGNGIVAAGAVLSCVGIVLFVVAVILAAVVVLF